MFDQATSGHAKFTDELFQEFDRRQLSSDYQLPVPVVTPKKRGKEVDVESTTGDRPEFGGEPKRAKVSEAKLSEAKTTLVHNFNSLF